MDTLSACVLHNLFDVGSLPVGATRQDERDGALWSLPWRPPEGRPSDIFKEHIVVSPYPEEDVAALIEVLGPNAVAMGSDFPHPEGASEPREFVHAVRHLDPRTQALFLGGNARRLIGLPEPIAG